MKLTIKATSDFKKDLKKANKRGKSKDKIIEIINRIAKGETLEIKLRDHLLYDNKCYKNARECHIEPDWLLIYFIDEKKQELILVRTGTHSDLFK